MSTGSALGLFHGSELSCLGTSADFACHDCLLGKRCLCSLTAREVVVWSIQGITTVECVSD